MKLTDANPGHDRRIIWGCYGLIVLYSVSLTYPALDDLSGLECLTSVPFAIMFLAWWANLFFVIGLPSLLLGNPLLGFWCGTVATFLSLSTLILFSFGSLGPGYFIWFGCMVGLTWLAWLQTDRLNPEE